MTHEVVRCAYQLFTREPADLDKGIVAIGNYTFGIGGGNQPLLSGESAFALGDGLVITHVVSIRKTLTGCRHAQGFV